MRPAGAARCCSSTTRTAERCRPRRRTDWTRCRPSRGSRRRATRRFCPTPSRARRRPSSSTPARQLPALAVRLGTDAALLLPLQQRGERVGLLAIGVDGRCPARSARRRDIADAFVDRARAVPSAPEREPAARPSARARRVRRHGRRGAERRPPSLDAFCLGANRLFGAERDIGLGARSANATSGPACLLGRASRDGPRTGRGRRRDRAGRGGDASRAGGNSPRQRSVRDLDHHHSAARLPPGARLAAHRGRPHRDRTRAGGARSRRSARPPALERHGEPATAGRPGAVAARAREHLRLDYPSGRRLGSPRPNRARQPRVCQPRRLDA